jgi:hypothetical protein
MGVGVGVLELPVGGGSEGEGVGSGELLPEYVAEAVKSLWWCVEDRVGDGDVLDVRVTATQGQTTDEKKKEAGAVRKGCPAFIASCWCKRT